MTHIGAHTSATKFKSLATFKRNAPIKSHTVLYKPAPNNTISPVCAPVCANIACKLVSSKNLAMGELTPSRPLARSSTFIQARPLAPYLVQYMPKSSICLRESEAPLGTRNAATRPSSCVAQSVNTLNSLFLTLSAISTNSRLMRKSGLSEPYRRMVSA